MVRRLPTLRGIVRDVTPRGTRRAMKGLLTILIFIFAVGFTASACAGEAAPNTQAACEKAGMHWDATASAPRVKCHFRLA
jgi:hypothetical protein